LLVFAFTLMTIAGQAQAPASAQNLLTGLAIDGIRCDTSEGAVEHIHTHLQLIDRGHAVQVPGGIGIPQGAGCLYWAHTHINDGIIHIEAPVVRPFSLGQFFDIWDVELSRSRAGALRARGGRALRARGGRALRVTVNGKVWKGDPRSIPLRDREEIVIQNGPPYSSGRPADWSKL